MPLRVVLADDHLIFRQGLKALLERHGFGVVADEPDGRAAVEAVRRLAPDVVVLDRAMPPFSLVRQSRCAGALSGAPTRVEPYCAWFLSRLAVPREGQHIGRRP